MRLFIAIEISSEVRQNLCTVMNELRKVWTGVRFVRPEGIHLTLKFLGEVHETDSENIAGTLNDVRRLHMPFQVEVSSLGRFPEKGRPRVVWSGVKEETGILARLADDIEVAMEKIGFEKETRGFKPHITIGRVKGAGGEDRGLRLLEENSERNFGSYEVDRFHLIKSTLLPDGARYEKLRTFELGKNE